MAMNEFGAGFKIYAKDYASGVFGKVGKNFSNMSSKADSDAKRIQAGMMRIGKGMGLIAAGFGIVRPLQVALREATKLNKALAEVATLTDEATFPVAKMKDLVKDLSAEYGDESVTQAKALYQTISAGYSDAADAAAMMTTANKLAVGGVTDVATAVDGLTNVMNTYSAANLESLDVSDAMFIAMREGKTTIGELASQIGRVAPGAEALGIKFDELFAAISAVTSKGINTAQTSSGLAAAMANVVKPTADATKEAKRLGIEFSAASLRSKGLSGFLDSITQSAKFNDDTISKLFGSIEAFKVMTALTSNESEKFNAVMEKMAQRAGSTAAAVAKMEKTFEHQSKRMKQITNNLLTSVGDTVESIIAPILRFVNWVTSGITKFFESLPEGARKAIVSVVGAFGGLVGVAGVIMVVTGALSMLGIGLTSILLLFGKLLLFAVPLTVLFAGLGIAAYSAYRAFQKNTGGISDSWEDMLKKVKLAWGGMMAIIKGEPLDEELKKQLTRAENQGVLRFLKGFERFVEKVKTFWRGLVAGFEAGVDQLAESAAMKKLQGAIDGVVAMFTGEGKDTDPKVLKQWEEQGMKTGQRLAQLGEIALNALAAIVNFGKWFASVISQITAGDIVGVINGAITSFEGLWAVLKEVAMVLGIIFKLISSVINLIQTVGAVIGDFLGMTAGVVSSGFDVFTSIFQGEDAYKQAKERARLFQESAKPFEATQEQLGDFARIWGSETTYGLPESEVRKIEDRRKQQEDFLKAMRKPIMSDGMNIREPLQIPRSKVDIEPIIPPLSFPEKVVSVVPDVEPIRLEEQVISVTPDVKPTTIPEQVVSVTPEMEPIRLAEQTISVNAESNVIKLPVQTINAGGGLEKPVGPAQVEKPAQVIQFPKPTEPEEKIGVAKDPQAMAILTELRGQRESILRWMNTSTSEWKKKEPGLKSYQEATAAERAQFVAELDRIERMIKALSNRPVDVRIGQEKVARAVQTSDRFTGTRDLDESFGY